MPSGTYSVFDGYTLTLYRADGSIVGSWPAISGERGHQKPSEQKSRDVGPLPEGEYSFQPDQIQHLSQKDAEIGAVSKLIHRGRWPGSIWAWGTQRVFLVPGASTDTFGRSNFSIHGGWLPGSHGCIDLGPNEESYFTAIRRMGGSTHNLFVQFDPRLETEAHPLASRILFDGVSDYYLRPLREPPKEKPVTHTPGDKTNFDSPASGPDLIKPRGELQSPSLGNALSQWPTSRQMLGASQFGEPEQIASSVDLGLPQHVIDAGNLLRANGYEITPRTMYVSHVLGPQAAVDLFKRTGSTGSPAVPSPDAATGDQMRAWVRALRLGPAAAGIAGGMTAAPRLGPAIADPNEDAPVANRPFA